MVFPYISLFAGGGIGDVGFRKAGLLPIVVNELVPDRAQLAKLNFPEADIVEGDIHDRADEIVETTKRKLSALDLDIPFLISATPPCQGMSKNGIGSILKAMREGKRSDVDDRNYLFKPVITILDALRPTFLFFENVDRMANAYIVEGNARAKLVNVLQAKLAASGYVGEFRILNMAHFGVPQFRRRIVGIFARKDEADRLNLRPSNLFPSSTHANKTITLRETIGHLPPLDSVKRELASSKLNPLHRVPISRPDLYFWISHTKEGDTAFNNNCCISCGFSSGSKSVHCEKCGMILAKPVVESGGEIRVIKGFISAYKRMTYDETPPTITTRSAYACSDHNLHPNQNRVLSTLEVALIQGLNPLEYRWGPLETTVRGKKVVKPLAHDTLLRDILGEPVPPRFSEVVGLHLARFARSTNRDWSKEVAGQLALL